MSTLELLAKLTILAAIVYDNELVQILLRRSTDQRQDRAQQHGTRLIMKTNDNAQLGETSVGQRITMPVATAS